MDGKKCFYPQASVTIEANGDVRLCSSSLPIGNLRESNMSLKDIWNSEMYTDICSRLRSGSFPKECRSCQKAEAENLKSRRILFNEKCKRLYGEETFNENMLERSVRHMSIAFSNHCNLSCSMCGSLYSTSWRKMDEKAIENGIDFRIKQSARPFELSDENFAELLSMSEKLDTILIKGGEPLISKRCIDFLKSISNKKIKPRVFIQTNGTYINSEIKELISELKIDVGVSIDGVGETFEWIRQTSFEKVIQNLLEFENIKGRGELFVDYTISLFNVANLDKFLEYFSEFKGVSKISFTTIARQAYNSVRVLPLDYRLKVIEGVNFDKFDNLEGVESLKEYFLASELNNTQKIQAFKWLNFLEGERGALPNSEVRSLLREWGKDEL